MYYTRKRGSIPKVMYFPKGRIFKVADELRVTVSCYYYRQDIALYLLRRHKTISMGMVDWPCQNKLLFL